MQVSLLHVDRHTHPWMNAALERVYAFGEPCDLQLAALKDSSSGYRYIAEPAGTFLGRILAIVERGNKAAAKLLDFSKGVRFAALVDDAQHRIPLNIHNIGFKVPAGIGSARGWDFEPDVEIGRAHV